VFGPSVNGIGSAGSQAPARQASPGDPVSRGVDVGYRVIDEYMRQGQAFAKTIWPAGASGAAGPPDPQKMMERMFQYASDLASVWLEYAQVTMGQVPAASPFGAPGRAPGATKVGGFDIGSKPAPTTGSGAQGVQKEPIERVPAETASVSVDIVFRGRAEVTVDLKPGSSKAALAVHDLRERNPQLPRIAGVAIEGHAAENRVVVRLNLPDDQPPGTYAGLIVDDVTNLPMGTLSVRVLEKADA
jgi:hypothetical protein